MGRLPFFSGWLKHKHHRIKLRLIMVLLGGLLAITWHGFAYLPAHAQIVTQARITEIVSGNQVYIQNRRARVNSTAQRSQQVRTGNARASLLFNTGAVARLAQNSSLTIGQCARLQQGTLLVNGSLNSCTQSNVAGVRGTLYTLTINRSGIETLNVFEGTVEVIRRGEFPPSNKGGDQKLLTIAHAEPEIEAEEIPDGPLLLGEGESLTYNPILQEILVEKLTTDDFERLLQGPLIAEFAEEIPGLGDLEDAFDRLFPDVPFPGISIPDLDLPSIPSGLPF